MWTLFTIAPYAFFIGIVGISYFLVWPFVQYIRDPKGIFILVYIPGCLQSLEAD